MLSYWGGCCDCQSLVHTVQISSSVGVPASGVHYDLLLHYMQGLCNAAADATCWLLCKLCIGAISLHSNSGVTGVLAAGLSLQVSVLPEKRNAIKT